jgi:hypothetical protein
MKTLVEVAKDSFYAIGRIPRRIADGLDPYRDSK